jgi:hypothetical protein
VDVEVLVGSSTLTRVSTVSMGTDVTIGLLDVGVSSRGVRVDAGGAVVGDAGRLHDDIAKRAAMTAIQK